MTSSIETTAVEPLPQNGAELRAYRDRAGIQQQVLAVALEMTPYNLSRIETGFVAIPDDLAERYVAAVRQIARERAQAVGADTPEPALA